jgi:hypothetical protein
MSRPLLDHLAWSKAQHGRWPLSLADSAVATPDLESLGLPHQAGTPAPAAGRFELLMVPGRAFGEPRGVRIAPGGEPARSAAALDIFQIAIRAFPEARGMATETA